MAEAALLPKPAPLPPRSNVAPPCGQVRFAQRKATLPDAAPRLVAPPRDAGRPIEPGVRGNMERSFGRDFSAVRVHDDAAAHDSARALNARAYAAGNDIVFGEGAYRPTSTSGRALLAHELAHTVQQGGVQMKSLGPLPAAASGSELEREADRAALSASAGRPVGNLTRVGTPAVFKSEDDPAAAGEADDTPAAYNADGIPTDMKVVKEFPDGPGATQLVVEKTTPLKLPNSKGGGSWVKEIHNERAGGGSLLFTPNFSGKSYSAAGKAGIKTKMHMEKPGDKYKYVWTNNYGFKTLKELAQAFKGEAEKENPDAEVKAAYDDKDGGRIIKTFAQIENLKVGKCDIDHIVEKQLGGTSTPSNVQILDSTINQASGRETYAHLIEEVDRALKNRPHVTHFQMRFTGVEIDSTGMHGSALIEKALRNNKVRGSDDVRKNLEGKPVSLDGGGNREVVYVRDKGVTPFDKGYRKLIPGLHLTGYERLRGVNYDRVTATIKSKPMIPGPKDVTLRATKTTAPKESDGAGGIAGDDKAKVSEFRKLTLDTTLNRNLAFHYPYLSPGSITKLELVEGKLVGEGTITPSVGILGPLKVRFSESEFALVQDLNIEALNKSKPMHAIRKSFRFTSGELKLDLREFKPSGELGFSAGPSEKPYARGKVTAKEDGGAFVVEGEMQPGEGLPVAEGTTGKVRYKQGAGWSGELQLPPKMEILPNASVTGKLGFTEVDGEFSPYAEGSATATVLNQSVTFTIGWNRKYGKITYGAKLPIEKPFPMVKSLNLSAYYDGGDKLFFNGKVDLDWKGIVTGKGDISYTITKSKSWFYGKVGIGFKYKKLAGEGTALFGDKGIRKVTATCSYQLTDEITAKVGVKYSKDDGKKMEDRFYFTGSVDVSQIQLFGAYPKKPKKHKFFGFDSMWTFPVPPFPAISVTLTLDGELGAQYQVGPGTISGKVAASGYLLSEDPRLKAELSASLKIPAYGELYGRFGAKIGAAVGPGLVGADGGIYLTPSVRLNLVGSLNASGTYQQGKGFGFNGNAKVDGGLKAKFDIDAVARVYALRGAIEKEWLIPIKSWGPLDLIDDFTITLGTMSYQSWADPKVKWPSFSDFEITPKKYDPMTMIENMLKTSGKEQKSGRSPSAQSAARRRYGVYERGPKY